MTPAESPRSAVVSRLLRDVRSLADADPEDREALVHLVYDELHELASRLMRGERAGHTLRPTALVHEAYLRLVDSELHWEGRAHFFGIAARAMRQVLVDHARRRQAAKRDAGRTRVPLDDRVPDPAGPALDVIDLHRALERLASTDERTARVAEIRLFTGLPMREIAQMLGVSKRTADGDWAMARLWLARELEGPA
jgi:RNA polymerase sigma-70 factor (ECF subfamily)